MSYVDLRKGARERRYENHPSPGHKIFPKAAAILVLLLGWLAMFWLLQDALAPTVVVLVLLLLALLVADRERRIVTDTAAFGGEKQLLIALRDLGGLTPVEAALETSLSVDEAEEILTHLADRGHLRVESHDGVLVYDLPRRGLA